MVETEQWKEDIAKYNISLEAPEVKPEDGATYYLIRHGRSLFNHQWEPAVEKHGWGSQQMQDVMNDGSLVDADLHPIGYLQCEVNAPKVAPINFTRVFVSPMNRAMQTCIGMFKNHPNVANIKFTILPISREIWCGSQDIPQDVNVLLERYADGKPDAQGLKFDFSYIKGCHGDPQLWSLSTVTRMA